MGMEMKEATIYQLHDAKMDMLKGLNELTDNKCPTFCQVQQMGILAKAVKDMQEAENLVMAMHMDHDDALTLKK